jgi:hypothetical protein
VETGIHDDVPVIAGSDSAILQQHLDPALGHALGDEWGFGKTPFPPLVRKADVAASDAGTGARQYFFFARLICPCHSIRISVLFSNNSARLFSLNLYRQVARACETMAARASGQERLSRSYWRAHEHRYPVYRIS